MKIVHLYGLGQSRLYDTGKALAATVTAKMVLQ